MRQASLFEDQVRIGSQVTARPDNKVRGGKVLKIFENQDILFEYYGPKRKVARVKKGKYQLSKLWNDPDTSKRI